MYHLVKAINKAIDDENWYAALTLSLTLPDICTKYSDPTLPGKVKYPKWFDEYMNPEYKSRVSGLDCYALRCAFLHEGTGLVSIQEERKLLNGFVFIASKEKNAHLNYGDGILQLDLITFCQDICNAVEKWMLDIHPDLFSHKVLSILVPEPGDRIIVGDGVKVIQPDGRERWGLAYERKKDDSTSSLGNMPSEFTEKLEEVAEGLKRVFLLHGIAMMLPQNNQAYIGVVGSNDFMISQIHIGRIDKEFQTMGIEALGLELEGIDEIRDMSYQDYISSLNTSMQQLFDTLKLHSLVPLDDTAIVGWDVREENMTAFSLKGFRVNWIIPEPTPE